MVEQIYVNELSEETALDLMPIKLSSAHRAIYEGVLKGKPVRLTSLDGNIVLATARSCSAAARMLGIGPDIITRCLDDGLLMYFEQKLCLIEEIKGEEVDKFGRTSAFDPWFSTLQLENWSETRPVKTQYNPQKAAAGKKGADSRNKLRPVAEQLEIMFIQAKLLEYGDNEGCRFLLQPILSERHANSLLAPRYRHNRPSSHPSEPLVDIGVEIGAKMGEAVGRIVSTQAHVTDEVGKSFGKKFGTDVGAAVGAQVAAEVKDGANVTTAEVFSKVQAAVVAEVRQKVIAAIRVAQEFQDLNKP